VARESPQVGLAGAVLLALAAASPGFSQPVQQQPVTVVTEDVERAYDAAFQEMLRRPADLDVLFKFANLAVRTGDLEGAISVLERMLLIDANLPRVRLELGVLYFRLGSFETARTYLQSALATPGIPDDVRARAQQFLAEVEARQSPSQLSAEIFAGLRYQSSANLGPTSQNIRLFGLPATLSANAVGTADWGAIGSLQVRHFYDFGAQHKAGLETVFTSFATRQFQVRTSNLSLLEITTGPRFAVFPGSFEDFSVRPFLTAGHLWVNDVPYYASWGTGIEYAVLLAEGLRHNANFAVRRHEHDDQPTLPTSGQFRGTEYAVTTGLQYQLTDMISLQLSGGYTRYLARVDWQSYTMWSVGAGLAFRVPVPLFYEDGHWTFSIGVTKQWWSYDRPDVTVDPNTMRTQDDTILNLSVGIPLDDRKTFVWSAGRHLRAASLPNYKFINDSTLVGVSFRF